MASLLERMNVPATGPVRSKSAQSMRPTSAPYNRAHRTPKGDVNSSWSHDLYEQHNSLSARLNLDPSPPKASFNPIAQKALREATSGPSSSLSIKGASAMNGNVVEVTGLVQGTTAEDVVAIFKRCGVITSQKAIPGSQVTIRLTYKTPSSAEQAVRTFNGQAADGQVLAVRIVGSTTAGTSLSSRFGKDGLGVVRQEGSVDILMDSTGGGSKMRSDALVTDPRAHVLVAPPGANPSDYTQTFSRRGGGRGRGRRGRGGRGGGGGRMDVD
ncbi:hypothetical protein E1B28_010090 [Marasmius oreades]|uniref:RRM domain-containing protein n=1 Tax=Marasmius oreades TaxID=181124 RepID=A0A9P7RWD7_9AGAR|nr:uncharacterized protein E1B28_010090 [Marasmius oreades]KAG7091029.1 hypothetical protein E1B28_010090 [Marasmius oreades]